MKISQLLFAAVLAIFCINASIAQTVDINGGQTNVLLDTATLEAAANLTISSTSGPVIAPGELGAASVAFPVNARDAAAATTFSYDPADFLGTFSGAIEHQGSVLFNSDAIEVGDFTIGFDAGRAAGQASGFFVESNVGIEAIIFDVAAPSTLEATESSLTIGADLLVSPEFAQVLLDASLATSNLSGADVGDALVSAIVPEPGSFALIAIGLLAASQATRRQRS